MQEVTGNIYVLVLLGMAGTAAIAAALVFFLLKYQRSMLRQQIKLQQVELAHQKAMLHATITSQEEERKRIGSDLHDEVCGALSNLQRLVTRVIRSGAVQEKEADDRRLHQEFRRIIDSVRTISHHLSPPALELFGLYEALEELCDAYRQDALPDIQVINRAAAMINTLPFPVMLAVYRMVQELLSNTVKHAAASAVRIELSDEAGELVIAYSDNGRGLSKDYRQKKGMGMSNIFSRAEMAGASHTIGPPDGKGFNIVFRIPAFSFHQSQNCPGT